MIKSFDFENIKNKIFIRENIYFLATVLVTFFLDRYSKVQIIKNYSNNTFYFNDFINLDLIWNTGIGFGLLTTADNLIYNVISSIIGIVIIIIIYISLTSDKFDKIVFSFITGGALGNFYDRLVFKGVPDFIDLHYGNFHWFTFNLADIFISIGIIAFIIKGFFIKNN